MIAKLDEIAFQFLIVVYNLLGVQDIPREEDPNWKIVERWKEEPGQYYRLVMESDTVPELCRNNQNAYVVFPQVYVGRHDIFVDGRLVSTNSLTDRWSLSSSFDRTIIKCGILAGGATVRLVTDSYLKFFASVSSYPAFTNKYPRGQFFYTGIYVVAAVICICFGLLGTILMSGIVPGEKISYFVLQEFFLCMFMYSYAGGTFVELPMYFQHSLVFLSFAGGFFLFISTEIPFLRGAGVRPGVMGFFVVLFMIGLFRKNLTQLFILMLIFPYILFVVYIFIKKIRDKERILEILLYFTVGLMGIKDSYVNLVVRAGVSHLSLLVILVSTVSFLKVLKMVSLKKNEAETLSIRLTSERTILEKINEMNEEYREIIHDIKSPLTAIRFFAKRSAASSEQLGLAGSRVDEIIGRIEESGYRKVVDWYSIAFCERCIVEICSEKFESDYKVTVANRVLQSATEAFLDPVDFKIVVAELIDNSRKAGSSVSNFELYLDDTNAFIVEYSDNGSGIDQGISGNFGEKGISKNSSGVGLFGIKSKVEAWGSTVKLGEQIKGFTLTISFRSRTRG